ncbi:acyl-CoA carboxylase subunit epsilon [Arthrobacter sp. I2-34]|uniref:Acyl-CoA carboxylase subunit epsilon n=1 Tax=Arthrobacter hankyongi TaxID=2904801 RepID=A0ABS9L1D2_9MICC|nr:acyl-CoA carboxylase subunit epsilon [Arthrobacter hankyongi]MCG2620475.1 acyl-CoA carboxylase subunit epsilon [Arthrobacter hankyongi]
MYSDPETAQAPLLTVARGNPTPEELAALTAVVLALQPADDGQEPATGRPRRRSPRRRELLRPVIPFGPGAWRHTFR